MWAKILASSLLGMILQSASWAVDAAALDLLRAPAKVPGDTLSVVLSVADVLALGQAQVEAIDLTVNFNADELQFVAARAGNAFTLAANAPIVFSNQSSPGVLRTAVASVFGAVAIADGSGLLVLEFRVLAGALSVSELSVQSVQVAIDETAFIVELPGPGLLDGDADGVNDAWESLNGLNPRDPGDAALDPDLDGVSTLAELLAGSDPNDINSVPAAPYTAQDLPGLWDQYTYSDDASQANAPYAEHCGLEIDEDGRSSADSVCENLDGVLDNLSAGAQVLTLDASGAVLISASSELDEVVMSDAHMDIGRTVIAGFESLFGVGADADQQGAQIFNVLTERGTAYRQQDMAGTWHLFQYGDNIAADTDDSFWLRYRLDFDVDGALVTPAEFFTDDAPADANTVFDSDVLLAADGLLQTSGDLALATNLLFESMDAGKTVIAGVTRESFAAGTEIEDSVRVWLKQGASYAQSDAEGVWHIYAFSDLVGEQGPMLSKFNLLVDANGVMSGERLDSDGEAFAFDGSLMLSDAVATRGQLTIGGELALDFKHQHLRLDADKTVLAGVFNADEAQTVGAPKRRAGLLVGVKSVASTPRLMLPAADSVLSAASTSFAWLSNGTAVTRWQLLIGHAAGSSELFNSGVLDPLSRSVLAPSLPTDGRVLHARLRYDSNGWKNIDRQFQAADFALPELLAPATSTALDSTSVNFSWSFNGHPVQSSELYIGTTLGGRQIARVTGLGHNDGQRVINNLPDDGRAVYVRLRYRLFGVWQWRDYQFRALNLTGTQQPALSSPLAGSTLAQAAVTFNWTLGDLEVQDIQFLLGSTLGRSDIANSGSLGASGNSFPTFVLPVDGRTVYARLRYRVAGKWKNLDYTFTAADFPFPALTPSTVETPLSGSTVTFEWMSNGHAVTDYQLVVGTRVGRNDLADSGITAAGSGNSFEAQGLPTDGRILFVRLRSRIAGSWSNADYTFTAADFRFPSLTSPNLAAPLPGSVVVFEWVLNGHPVQDQELWIGSRWGRSDLARARRLGTTATSFEIETLPADGRTVYVRLRYRLFGKWAWADYAFSAADSDFPALLTPTPSVTEDGEVILGDSEVIFTWDNYQHAVTDTQVLIGSRVGRSDLANSRSLGAGALSYPATGLPTDGRSVHVRLRSRIGGKWINADSTYTAASFSQPTLESPARDVTLDGAQATFIWNNHQQPVQDTELWVGTSFGGRQIVNARKLGAVTTERQVDNLPLDGRPVYVRLRSRILGKWVSRDYQYKAAGDMQPSLLNPTPGSTLTDSTVTFSWSLAALDVQDVQFFLGSKLGGSNYGKGTALGTTQTWFPSDMLPADGSVVYARLRYKVAGKWKNLDYTFTAADSDFPALLTPVLAEVDEEPSALSSSEVTFTWDNYQHAVTDTQVLIGSRVGGSDLANSRSLGAGALNYPATGLPADGRSVYVRLRSRIGGKWINSDSTYTAATFSQPTLESPARDVALDGAQATFIWNNHQQPVQDTELWVGTSFGGKQIVNARRLGVVTSEFSIDNLPVDGRPIYVRLRSRILGKWLSRDYQYKAAGDEQPSLLNPKAGSTLTGSTVTFSWSLAALDVQDVQFFLGSKLGGSNYGKGTALGTTQTWFPSDMLPADGSVVYARLRYKVAGKWKNLDYTFIAIDSDFPALLTPTPSVTEDGEVILGDSEVIFTWDNYQHAVTDTQVLIGSRVGRSDLANSRSLGAGVLSYPATGLPADGRSVYVRLRSRIGGKWINADSTYTAANFERPGLLSPTAGEALDSSSHLFTWTFNGHPVTDSELWVGTSFGGKQLANARKLGGQTTQLLVNNLPANARTVYVRLRYRLLGKWQYTDYVIPVGFF